MKTWEEANQVRINAAAEAMARDEGVAPCNRHYDRVALDLLRQHPAIITLEAEWFAKHRETVSQSWKRAFLEADIDPYQR